MNIHFLKKQNTGVQINTFTIDDKRNFEVLKNGFHKWESYNSTYYSIVIYLFRIVIYKTNKIV